MTLALPSVMLLYPERKRRKALTFLVFLLSNLIHSIPCLNLLETNCQESLGNVTFQGIPPGSTEQRQKGLGMKLRTTKMVTATCNRLENKQVMNKYCLLYCHCLLF